MGCCNLTPSQNSSPPSTIYKLADIKASNREALSNNQYNILTVNKDYPKIEEKMIQSTDFLRTSMQSQMLSTKNVTLTSSNARNSIIDQQGLSSLLGLSDEKEGGIHEKTEEILNKIEEEESNSIEKKTSKKEEISPLLHKNKELLQLKRVSNIVEYTTGNKSLNSSHQQRLSFHSQILHRFSPCSEGNHSKTRVIEDSATSMKYMKESEMSSSNDEDEDTEMNCVLVENESEDEEEAVNLLDVHEFPSDKINVDFYCLKSCHVGHF